MTNPALVPVLALMVLEVWMSLQVWLVFMESMFDSASVTFTSMMNLVALDFRIASLAFTALLKFEIVVAGPSAITHGYGYET